MLGRVHCLYCDLDGTLLGPGASLVRDADGGFELLGVRALEACHRAGAEVMLSSGRRRVQVAEDARLIGQSAFVFEAGAGLVVDGELEWLTGEWRPGTTSVHAQIEASGAPAILLHAYPGRLEPHTPWHRDREVSHLFRGSVDPAAAEALLRGRGVEGLRLVDNGTVRRRSPALSALSDVHAYHLVPAAVSKARAIARHMRIRGYEREECVAVGDSREDLGAADAVGTFWLVANALERDPSLAGEIARRPNVRVAAGSYGAGVYEAVVTTLAERR
jgi:hydroxymethylpyrimidine pyrophosphatase-like HAD family hydrolase